LNTYVYTKKVGFVNSNNLQTSISIDPFIRAKFGKSQNYSQRVEKYKLLYWH